MLVEDVEAIERTHSIEVDTETPETALIAEESATLLATAIATLSAPLPETLLPREVQELSYREIAGVIDRCVSERQGAGRTRLGSHRVCRGVDYLA